jgi:hypothetical protein
MHLSAGDFALKSDESALSSLKKLEGIQRNSNGSLSLQNAMLPLKRPFRVFPEKASKETVQMRAFFYYQLVGSSSAFMNISSFLHRKNTLLLKSSSRNWNLLKEPLAHWHAVFTQRGSVEPNLHKD